MHIQTKQYIIKLALFTILVLNVIQLKAQCELNNSSFQPGEFIAYDMYFKYGLLYTKAGTSTLSVSNSKYAGKDAYKMMLTANSSKAAKAIYSLSDTMIAYTTKKLVPLAYRKRAHEKNDFRTEDATYEYLPGGKIKLRNINKKNYNLRYDTTFVSNECIYDYISVIYYARTLDFSKIKKGDVVSISFLSGRTILYMRVEHEGLEVISANDGQKYNCIRLVLAISNGAAFEDKNEAMKVYLTNDANRVPVRIESKLKIGSTRAILKSYSGLKH